MNISTNFKPLTDDFIFSLVMRNVEICKGMLERIIPETEFGEIHVTSCENAFFTDETMTVEQQKTLKFDPDAKGIRFDAYAKAEKMWAEIEMQTYTGEHIGKRSRYYHSNMDMDLLDSGKQYTSLKTSYVIFICTYDYIGAGEAVYFFQNFDIKNQLCFTDERYTIILNTKCDPSKVPDQLKPLFAYINDATQVGEDPFIHKLHEAVKHYNTKEWRAKLVTLEEKMKRIEDRYSALIQKLYEDDRFEDIIKIAKSAEYREELMKEYDL